MIAILIAVFIWIALADVPKLIQEKNWKELTVYSAFFIAAFISAVLLTLGVTPPSPMVGIEYIMKDLLHVNLE